MYKSPLRDLARKIREVAQHHPARSQVAYFLNHIDEHINALARIEEFHRNEETKTRPIAEHATDHPR